MHRSTEHFLTSREPTQETSRAALERVAGQPGTVHGCGTARPAIGGQEPEPQPSKAACSVVPLSLRTRAVSQVSRLSPPSSNTPEPLDLMDIHLEQALPMHALALRLLLVHGRHLGRSKRPILVMFGRKSTRLARMNIFTEITPSCTT